MNSVDVLSHADPLPSGARRNLASVAKELSRSGAFVALRFDEKSGRLQVFKVPARIPARELDRGDPSERRPPRYSSDRKNGVWRGWVRVPNGGRWSVRLERPAEGEAALLTIERKGNGIDLLPRDAALVIPQGEAEAVMALLKGLFARTRKDRAL